MADAEGSGLREHAGEILRQARMLPQGADRRRLRRLARMLLTFHKLGIRANVRVIERSTWPRTIH